MLIPLNIPVEPTPPAVSTMSAMGNPSYRTRSFPLGDYIYIHYKSYI